VFDTFSGEPIADELVLKMPYWTTSVVDARLRDAFPGEEYRAAAVLLSTLVGEVPGGDIDASDLATCRLMLAAIKASEGDLSKLTLWVQAAHMDPRDLIAAAEYRRQLHGQGGRSERADLAEYLVWASGETAARRAH
jgi:hypothetical protein